MWIASLTATTMVFSSIARADIPLSTSPSKVEVNTPLTAEQNSSEPSSDEPPVDTAKPADDFEFSIPTSEPNTSTDDGNEDTDAKALDEPEDEPDTEQVSEVGKVSSDGVKEAEKKRTWQRVGIAVAAVIVATVALILVSSHPGK